MMWMGWKINKYFACSQRNKSTTGPKRPSSRLTLSYAFLLFSCDAGAEDANPASSTVAGGVVVVGFFLRELEVVPTTLLTTPPPVERLVVSSREESFRGTEDVLPVRRTKWWKWGDDGQGTTHPPPIRNSEIFSVLYHMWQSYFLVLFHMIFSRISTFAICRATVAPCHRHLVQRSIKHDNTRE